MKRILSFVVLLGFVFALPLFAEELYLEGIVFESGAPETSVAIINGEPRQPGEAVGDYTVKEVRADQVILQTSKGEIKNLTLADNPGAVAPTMSASAKTALDQSELVEPPDLSELAADNDEPLKINFVDVLSFARYATVQATLRNIHTAAMAYNAEFMGAPTLKTLVEQGYLNPEYGREYQGYRYRIESDNGEPVVFAEPAELESSKRSFLIDRWGNMKAYRAKVTVTEAGTG